MEELIYYLGEEKSSNLSGSELLRIINRKLLNIAKNNRHAIIVIDEAQLLNQESLEMIRLILNFQHNNSFLCTIILAGQPELLENINKIKPLEQRIAIKYHLKPLNGESTIAYIKFRIKKAGSDKPIFTNEALDRILHYSSGIPRKINNICNMSLLVSYSIKKDIITPDIIEQVVEE